jgi:hypothetical protein
VAYATLADYTATFSGVDDNLDDLRIPTALDVASSDVDEWCQRSFVVASGTSARTYRQTSTGLVMVDDFSTVTGLIVADDGGAALTINDDFFVDRPSVTSHPFCRLRFYPGRWPAPSWKPVLSVTAAWGWLAVPVQVKRATLLLAHDLMRPVSHGVLRLDVGAPFRVGQNRDVSNLLASFRRGDRTGL